MKKAFICAFALAAALCLGSCAQGNSNAANNNEVDAIQSGVNDAATKEEEATKAEEEAAKAAQEEAAAKAAEEQAAQAREAEEQAAAAEEQAAQQRSTTTQQLHDSLNITEIFYDDFVHGSKTAEYQKYIVLHDTESESDPASVVSYWEGNGNLISAHFVVGRDGSVVQCAPLDTILHHAGFGDTGHNTLYGVEDESRDDKLGTSPIGSWAADYGMNSYSIGIEIAHMTGGADYTEAQLNALDTLIAYIDSYYGFESEIIDHKAWRTGNSDTSAAFANYLVNYQTSRTHTGVAN